MRRLINGKDSLMEMKRQGLRQLLNLDQKKDKMIQDMQKMLHHTKIQLYDTEISRIGKKKVKLDISDESGENMMIAQEQCDPDFRESIQRINSNIGSMGVCAKQMKPGDVAWRCLDCEKDPTCIICKDCFEKADHEGHRVQLKRNVGGCCDCGDPEAWDQEHFCSDHKGYGQKPEDILKKLPKGVKQSADLAFGELCVELKKYCMILQNIDEESDKLDMTKDQLRHAAKQIILIIFAFLNDRIEEVPAFLYIVDQKLNSVYFDEESFVKSREHECCHRSFATQEQRDKFEADFEKLDPYFKKQVCTCTPLDLCFQTNNMLSKEAKKVIYGFLFKMFQSYTFKQSLTLSFAANYDTCLQDIQATNYDISGISVQVLTSPELTLLIYKDEQLLNNILNTLETNIKALVCTPRNSDVNYCCRHIIHDIKYLARPECLQFCIQNTQMIERLIKIGGEIYFCDIKEPRTSMINYMQDGGPFEELLNIELLLIKILNIYLKEVKFDDLEKNQSILQAFIETFQWVDKKLKSQNKTSHGLYVLPIHRCFSFYVTRLLFLNYYDQNCKNYIANTYPGQDLGMDQVFRMIFRSNLPQQYRKRLQDIQVTDDKPQIQEQKLPEVSKFDLEKVEDIESIFKNKVENMFTHGETKLATLKEAFQASSLLNEEQDSDESPTDDPLNYDDFFPSTDHEYSDQIPRTSKNKWKAAFKTIEDLVKMVLKTQIMQMSFLHEVSARKWIYHGQYLEMYPRLYFNVCDRLSFQDYASFQTLLALDDKNSQLMNFVIDNFGLDGQLQILIQGLKKEILRPMEFKRHKAFDSEKLRVQLLFFLRFLAQICVHEVAYLKQIYSRKDKDERQEENFDVNKQFFKKTWTNAVKKEAVHLLMLNRVNVSIQNLKKDMIEIFPKDEVFEDMLFEVSTQSRDIKNQVTFKLKDEYYSWFDPFMYISIDQHSQIFQSYQQNNVKDKFLDKGLNDIVGDYDSNYEFSTPLNDYLAKSLAGSSILMIIVPLLSNYLKYRKDGPPADQTQEEEKKDNDQPGGKLSKLFGMMTGDEEQKDNEKNEETEFFTKMIEFKRKMSTSGEKSNHDSSTGKRFSDLLLNKSPFSSGQKSERKQYQIDEVFLYKFVNVDVWKHCLKILVIVLKSGRASVIDKVSERLVKEMVAYKDDTDISVSEKRLLVFILTRIYELDKPRFKHVGVNLGIELPNDNPFLNPEFESSLASPQTIQKPADMKTDKAEEMVDDKKKLKLQKKKTNLLNKMKKKGNKFLAEKSQVDPKADTKKDEEKEKEECPQCSFCWGELTKESFLESPFGNFAHCNTSKLLYHSYEQTIKSQEQAFKNEDLSQQFAELDINEPQEQEEEKKQSSSLVETEYEEEKKEETKFSSLAAQEEEKSDSEDLANSIFDKFLSKIKKKKEQKPLDLQKLEIVEEICGRHSSKDDQSSFMNVYSGAGSIINNCKHYSHIECLRDYQQQQATISDHNYYKQLSGFSFGEFSCPLCKSINNCIMPSYALPEIVDEIPDERFVIDQNMKNLLDFYIDFFSELIKQQAGLTIHGESRSTVLRDLIGEPQRVLNHMVDHFLHRICLVDLKGIADFGKESGFEQLTKMWKSLKFVMHYTYKGDHDVLTSAKKMSSFIPLDETIFAYMQEYLEAALNTDDKHPILFRNITTVVIKLILVASMVDKSSPKKILQAFMPLIETQFLLATHFRSMSGKVSNLPDTVEELKDATPETKLPVYRKLFIVAQIVQTSPGALEAVLNQNSDEDELKTLQEYCNNIKSSETAEPNQEALDDLLQPYTEQYIQTCYDQLKNHLQNSRPKRMPLNLMLLTPYHNFELLELPDTFLSLQTTFYKKKCSYCDVEKQDSVTCLLCGKTMCWFKVKDGPCRNHPGQDKMEGLLSYHTRLHEGGTAIFIQTSSGALIYIQNGSSAKFDTPYRNKYGELANPQDKRWDSFVRDDETLKKVKQTIVDFQVSNCILQQRTNPDQRYKVYHKDAI